MRREIYVDTYLHMEPRLALIRYADHDYTDSEHFHSSVDAPILFGFVMPPHVSCFQYTNGATQMRIG